MSPVCAMSQLFALFVSIFAAAVSRLLLPLCVMLCHVILCYVISSQGGTDAGDHPPITPVRAATSDELGGGEAWLIYEYVARHFLASLSGQWIPHGNMQLVFACLLCLMMLCDLDHAVKVIKYL